MKTIVCSLLSAVVALGCARPASAQLAPDSAQASACAEPQRYVLSGLSAASADYARVAELIGAAPARPHAVRRLSTSRVVRVCEPAELLWEERLRPAPERSGFRVGALPFTSVIRYNSAYPRGRNNGAVWAGRGVSLALRGGVEMHWGPVSAAIAPVIAWQQNTDFEIPGVDREGYSRFIYPWQPGAIDWPLRFGNDPFWTVHPGQSYVRVDAYGVAVGVSTENLWWGPARRYPILMSNTAGGFPHVFVGTSGPLEIGIGTLEAEAVWGRLEESEYFDDEPANDHRLFAGLVVGYRPKWLPGLTVGFTRAYLTTIPPDGFGLADYILKPYGDPLANPAQRASGFGGDNQLASLFARWAFPEVGFEAYVEWAREDHWGPWWDLLMEPDHSQAYMLGFQQVVDLEPNRLRVYGELIHLGTSTTFRSGRPAVTYYVNSSVRQGYTHGGQLLGAAIGPGSDAQILGADLFTEWGRIGAYVERIRYANDAYYQIFQRFAGRRGHDVELTGGLRQVYFVGEVGLSWSLAYSKRWNRNFLGVGSPDGEFRTDTNWTVHVGATWRP